MKLKLFPLFLVLFAAPCLAQMGGGIYNPGSSSGGGGGGGTVTTTGTPSSGELTEFSGPTAITNGNLSGDVTTTNTLATSIASIQGTAVSGTTGTGNVVFSAAPTLTGTTTTGAISASGQLSTSVNGAASTPGVSFTGAPFTGGSGTTTVPYVYYNAGTAPTSFSTSGTIFGINSPSGFAGNAIDYHLNGGASMFAVAAGGGITTTGAISAGASITLTSGTSGFKWTGRSQILSPADSIVELINNGSTGFSRLDLGGTTSSFGALQTNGTETDSELADGSNQAAFGATGFISRGTKFTTSGAGCTVTGTTGGATAGSFTTSTSGTCTTTITMNGATGLTAPNGWSCWANDITSGVAGVQSASSATTAALKIVTTSGDTVNFGCTGF